ncbi:MAG: S-adenosylmethionine:tRNA ribosyltransferase-isomerase, partial [Deinococcales bacterium]
MKAEAPLRPTLEEDGEPIRYAYLECPQPLSAYQSIFARVPGSAEMPSAARPFSPTVVAALRARGVEIAAITLHAGVSSLELRAADPADVVLYAEPFEVSAPAAAHVNATRRAGGRVIAVGTTVVRALETAWQDGRVRPMRGFTRRYVHPAEVRGAVDGLLTGFHEPASTHLALLTAVAGDDLVREAYRVARQRPYLWHEFG